MLTIIIIQMIKIVKEKTRSLFRHQSMGKFCSHPEFVKKRIDGEKELYFPFLLCRKKGKQARSAGNGRHEVAEV
jgi:hypothetical protein